MLTSLFHIPFSLFPPSLRVTLPPYISPSPPDPLPGFAASAGVRRAEGKRRAGYVKKGKMTGRKGERRKERESPVRCPGIPGIPPASE
ncbi:hypothetical protein E2C01_072704 [Portunus trituberculatus]|uniref:Uncharacterized protein n=1 Tax=Portunus trituberculatus TaxID=210409 RepID=A0A5B7HYR3_PORTR|nr:hypothetical protein [Portunus trituberculatus]